MEELLANLNTDTDTSMFDAPFDDMDAIIGQPDLPVYDSVNDISIRQPSPSPPPPTAHHPPQTVNHIPDTADMSMNMSDFLAVDEPSKPAPVPQPHPPPVPKPAPSIAAPPVPVVEVDHVRNRLRPVAEAVVTECWSAASNPHHFVSSIRSRLNNGEENSHLPSTNVPKQQGDEFVWLLPPSVEGAVLDALLVKIVASPAASTRLMSYLMHSLVTGIVSQKGVLATCIKWVQATPNVSERVVNQFARMILKIIPHYRFSPPTKSQPLLVEVNHFLNAFSLSLQAVCQSPASLASDLAHALEQDRVIALVRCCARRTPAIWQKLDAAIATFGKPVPGADHVLFPNSAYSVAPELEDLMKKLKNGLCVGVTTMETITRSIGNLTVPQKDATLPMCLKTAFAVSLQVFGPDVAKALRDLWTQPDGPSGDFPLLVALEKATNAKTENAGQAGNQQHSQAPNYGFKNKVHACEAIVRFLAERSSQPGAAEQWKRLWGGRERLKRIICDAIPQVKNEIKSEAGALMIAMAVTCCANLCLGPSLQLNDPNDGLDPVGMTVAETQAHNEQVEETISELVAFAVGSLEEAAVAEEVPFWRSFGLWLLLLMSRSGSMLRVSGCKHARAARVLRAWAGMPSGTPGSHASHSSSSHRHGHGHQSSSSQQQTEGVSMFAASSAIAIIDVSDMDGSDESIFALCDDLVQ